MVFGIVLMLTLWALALSLALYGAWVAFKHFSSTPPHLDAPFGLYPVSILKPLKGNDPGLKENLSSFFVLDYPDYELIFSVASENDPARFVVEGLLRQFPRVPARLIVGEVEAGINPKVNNLHRSYELAKHDLLLISDSNVRVQPSYLRRMVGHMDSGVGMVTSVISGCDSSGLGGELEMNHLNTFYSRGMVLLDALKHPCVVGKSMLFRRSVANRFGGIKTLACYLAEDYMAGEAMRKLGLRVVTASDPIEQYIGKRTLTDFWQRNVRWGRIRKAQAPLAFVVEPLLGSIVSGLLGGFAFHHLFDVSIAAFLMVHLTIWGACDLVVGKSLRQTFHYRTPGIWCLREVLMIVLWFHIASGNTVQWRGKELTLRDGGLLALSEV